MPRPRQSKAAQDARRPMPAQPLAGDAEEQDVHGEVPVEHEGLVEHRAVVVRTTPASRPIGVGAEDMVEDHQVVVAKLLDGPRVRGDDVRVGADLELREHGTDLHGGQYRGSAL